MFKKNTIIAVLALVMSAPSLAGDSTISPQSNLTESKNFSGSNGEFDSIYSGSTTSKINFPGGHKQVIVNGITFTPGFGHVINEGLPPVKYTYSTCRITGGSRDRECEQKGHSGSTPACVLKIDDSGAQGCDSRKTVTSQYCSFTSCATSKVTYGDVVPITSVIGVN